MRHNNLKAEMARRDITIGSIADFLEVRLGTVSDKINGRSKFYFQEARRIRDKFFPDLSLEYLFQLDDDLEDPGKFHPQIEESSHPLEVR